MTLQLHLFVNSLLGIELHGGSVGPSLTDYPLQLMMEDDNGGYFKQGFPFRGRVSKCTKMQWPCLHMTLADVGMLNTSAHIQTHYENSEFVLLDFIKTNYS